jgi:hypothetical protein
LVPALTWRVDDGEPKLDAAFLDLDGGRVQLDRLLLLQLLGGAWNDTV